MRKIFASSVNNSSGKLGEPKIDDDDDDTNRTDGENTPCARESGRCV